jgi:hypothetical protein
MKKENPPQKEFCPNLYHLTDRGDADWLEKYDDNHSILKEYNKIFIKNEQVLDAVYVRDTLISMHVHGFSAHTPQAIQVGSDVFDIVDDLEVKELSHWVLGHHGDALNGPISSWLSGRWWGIFSVILKMLLLLLLLCIK